LEELKKSEGFVRSRLAKKVSVYKVPEVRFLYDESYDRFDRIEKALKKEQDTIDSFPSGDDEGDE
ncbi:MAG: ribosome-binding factor A, partial [Bacilli bacterium]|nr:ribosome-binding factor A [Bacilli bacterium]